MVSSEDRSLITTFVTLITILSIFSILVNFMPNEFVYTGKEYAEIGYAETWSPSGLWYGNITSSDNGTIHRTDYAINLHLTDYDIDLKVIWYAVPDILSIQRYWYTFYGLVYNYDWLRLEDDSIYITKEYALENLYEGNENVSMFTMHDSVYSAYYVQITFNTTKHESFDDAWDSGELEIWIGVGYEDVIAYHSTWALVTQILLFQAPEIHPVINAIIAVPIWACVAIMVFLLLRRALPF